MLYFIIPYSNPANFKRREQLLIDTVNRLKTLRLRDGDSLTIVVYQLVYDNQPPVQAYGSSLDRVYRTESRNVLWCKENLINLAVRNIYQQTNGISRYFAFIDADIQFYNTDIVFDTLNVLQKGNVFAQMFEVADLEDNPVITVKSFAYQYKAHGSKGYRSLHNSDKEYWHPGFAWAADIVALSNCGGLIDRTLGSADRHMAMALIGRAQESVPEGLPIEYLKMILEWQHKVKDAKVKLKCVPGKIKHFYHGSLRDRKYMERWDILKKHRFVPEESVTENSDGLLIWNERVPWELVIDVNDYFVSRNEDVPLPEVPHNPHNETSGHYSGHNPQVDVGNHSFGHHGNHHREAHDHSNSHAGLYTSANDNSRFFSSMYAGGI
ncbi:hypothetical protein HK098_003540 [Nowakowskiella sp. JEL0407]|nr:hypothetical protein HK098_003540 [Nowakowskiella sp. JEL0407]